jgi:glycosyltransferase involved in cell wall biosynthesis
MKLCYFGTFEKGYPRNDIFIKALRQAGVDLTVCNYRVKPKDAKQLGKVIYLLTLAFRFLIAYIFLAAKLIALGRVDGIIIGYPSHIDVLVFYPIIKLRRMPVFFNPLVSLHDTIITDRKLFSESSIIAKLLFFIDRKAFSLSDAVFWDTRTHSDFVASCFGIDKKKFHVVPAGPEEEFFEEKNRDKTGRFQVYYVGKYIPLHGMETIIEVARILKDEDIKFLLVGTGQDFDKIYSMAGEYRMKNVEFVKWMDRKEVFNAIKASHVVLGIFKKENKASRVVPNKVFEAMAAGAVVITGRSSAMQEWFEDGENIIMVEPENSIQLAEKIKWIKANYAEAEKIALKGRERVRNFASEGPVGKAVKEVIQDVLKKRGHHEV